MLIRNKILWCDEEELIRKDPNYNSLLMVKRNRKMLRICLRKGCVIQLYQEYSDKYCELWEPITTKEKLEKVLDCFKEFIK